MINYLTKGRGLAAVVLTVASLAFLLTILLSLWPSGAWADDEVPVAIYVRNQPYHGEFIKEGTDFYLDLRPLFQQVGLGCDVSNNQLLIQYDTAINLPAAGEMPTVFSYRDKTMSPAFRIQDGIYLARLSDVAKLLVLNYHFNDSTGILDIMFGPPSYKSPATVTGGWWSAQQPPYPEEHIGIQQVGY